MRALDAHALGGNYLDVIEGSGYTEKAFSEKKNANGNRQHISEELKGRIEQREKNAGKRRLKMDQRKHQTHKKGNE